MGIAKSTVQEPEQKPVQPAMAPATGVASYEWQGIPLDVIRHFGVELNNIPTKDLEQLKGITEWAKSKTDEPTIGNILQKISSIQRQVGYPALNEKSYTKVFQFVKMQRVIDEMTKRQDALRGARWL